MNLPDHIHPIAVDEALLDIGMTINEIRALTGNAAPDVAETIAGMEWQWGRRGGGGIEWAPSEKAARLHVELAQGYLVRRLAGPIEEVAK